MQATVPIRVQGGGDGEVGSRFQNRATEPPAGERAGQEVEQESGPPGVAQGNLQNQAGMLQEEEAGEENVPGWAVQYFPEEEVERSAGPYMYFRLPMQPTVVVGWGGQGSAAEPHFRLPTQPKVVEGWDETRVQGRGEDEGTGTEASRGSDKEEEEE